jgi:hypothetical protein
VAQSAVGLAVVIGGFARLIVGTLVERNLTPAAVYGNVIRFSISWLLGRRSR